ncbi:MAG TPA: J domain-containing protein [Thermodesulfobacteriaceae bacterium]|nr:J domain-containing protein [Thermodesulfobacteriaceae bacterium]
MHNKRWELITRARKLLGLPEEVTRIEIQNAYRERCKGLHPDQNPDRDTSGEMASLNQAYRILMEFSDNYHMQLRPGENGMTDHEWWMHHFGQDPVWAGSNNED